MYGTPHRGGELDPECCAELYLCTREADNPAKRSKQMCRRHAYQITDTVYENNHGKRPPEITFRIVGSEIISYFSHNPHNGISTFIF